MKTLKTFVCIAFIGLCFASCSDDDKSKSEPGDKIVGTWKIEKMVEDGDVLDLGPCTPKSRLEFKNDGTYFFKTYFGNDETNCTEDTTTGEWEYLGDNQYKTTEPGDDSDTVEIIFATHGNSFTTTSDNGDGTNSTITYTRV